MNAENIVGKKIAVLKVDVRPAEPKGRNTIDCTPATEKAPRRIPVLIKIIRLVNFTVFSISMYAYCGKFWFLSPALLFAHWIFTRPRTTRTGDRSVLRWVRKSDGAEKLHHSAHRV